MKIINDEAHYEFTINVIKALHLEKDIFFEDVANDEPYEVQVYTWIDKLYNQGKSIEEAIELIHRVRRFFITI